VFARRNIIGYGYLALATMATAVIGFGVWVHHMFAVGLPNLSMAFFSAASLLITIPTAVQIFAWSATIIAGRPVFKTAFLFVLGFGILITVANFFWSRRFGGLAGPDPWGGDTLEWATSSPPPPYDFVEIPTVRSVVPVWDQPELREGAIRAQDRLLAAEHETM